MVHQLDNVVFYEQLTNSLLPHRLFDVSKQVVGQMFVHGVNLFVSDLGSDTTEGNACVFYFLNILIDTTLGMALLESPVGKLLTILWTRCCSDLRYPSLPHVHRQREAQIQRL